MKFALISFYRVERVILNYVPRPGNESTEIAPPDVAFYLKYGPGRIRTYDQAVMSRMLCR